MTVADTTQQTGLNDRLITRRIPIIPDGRLLRPFRQQFFSVEVRSKSVSDTGCTCSGTKSTWLGRAPIAHIREPWR